MLREFVFIWYILNDFIDKRWRGKEGNRFLNDPISHEGFQFCFMTNSYFPSLGDGFLN